MRSSRHEPYNKDDNKFKIKKEPIDSSPKRNNHQIKQESKEPELYNDGRFAEPRHRVSFYKKRREEDHEKKARESLKQKEWDEKYAKWSKGGAQLKEREDKLKQMEEIVQENFTRYADDESMNNYLKDQIIDDDPMAQYFLTKQQKIEIKTGTVYPKYKGNFQPNRFSILPGYRWDGVNRSNGFEAKIMLNENKKKAQETVAYRSILETAE